MIYHAPMFTFGGRAMHIGFLTADLTHAHGWADYSVNLLTALERQGVKLTVLAARNSPPQSPFGAQPLLPSVTPLDRAMLARQMSVSPAARQALTACDLIHTTVELYAPLAALLTGRRRRPLAITVHGSYAHLPHLRGGLMNQLYRWAFRRAKLVCVSRYTAQVMTEVLPRGNIVVVNNGVDVEKYAHVDQLAHLHTKRGPTILTVGGVKPRKGTRELVQAIARVRDIIPDVQCLIAGSLRQHPDYVAAIREDIAALKLESNVHLMGFVPEDQLLAWYGAADLFVMPSINEGWKFEGFGLVHLEASAAGLPVIGTYGCGAEDAIIDGRTGFLVNQTNLDEELHGVILTLLVDTKRANRMGQAGRAHAQTMTWDHTAREMIGVYEGMLR